jgi:glycosyltransferase involved in cell wall biosynthesis
MHIVHIITRLILGGAQENTLITCKLLAERGHKVTLITGPALGPEGALWEKTKNAGYNVIVLDKMLRAIGAGHDLTAYRELKHLLRRLNPDIIHTHSAKAGILGRFAGGSLKGKLPGKPRPLPLVVHTIHGLAFHPYQSRLLNALYIAVERAAGKRTDAFITVADTMTEKAKAAGIGLNKPYTTAYSAIEEDAYLTPPPASRIAMFRQEHGIPQNAIVFVCIARIAELKGHEYIIESARMLRRAYPDCCWLFVGDGALTDATKAKIHSEGLTDCFKFTGLVPPEEIPLILHASDVLVHCSLREGLARVLPQAMLCAKPVVSFDIDGAKEVVTPKTGFLTEPENVGQLIGACEKLLDDPALRRRLGENGRALVKDKFAPAAMVNTIEQVYQKLMEFPF